jgi:hypothetical protein
MTSTTKHQHKSSLTQPSLLWLSELRLNRWCGLMLSLAQTVMSAIHWEWDCKTLRENSWKSGSMMFRVECEPMPDVCESMCANQKVNTRMDIWKARQVCMCAWTWVSECWDECQWECCTQTCMCKWWWRGTRITKWTNICRCCEGVCMRALYAEKCMRKVVMWHTCHPSEVTGWRCINDRE